MASTHQDKPHSAAHPLHSAYSLLLLIVLPLLSVGIAALVVKHPRLALAAVAAPAVGYLLRMRVDALTSLVLFVLYANLAVVAVEHHGVPQIAALAVPLLLGLPLFYHLVARQEGIVVTRAVPWMFCFLLVQAAGMAQLKDPTEALPNLFSFLIEGVCLYALITNVVRNEQHLRRAIWSLLAAGALMGGISVFQYATKTYQNSYGGMAQVAAPDAGFETDDGELKQKRAAGPLGTQNRFAQIMLMLLPLGMFCYPNRQSTAGRLLLMVTIGVIGLTIALTASRGAAVSFVLVMLCAVFLRFIKPGRVVIAGALLGGVLLLMPTFTARFDMLHKIAPFLTGQNADSIRSTDGSVRGRMTEMLAAGLMFADHPLLGVGPGMYKYHYRDYAERVGIRVDAGNRQAHSLYLGLAAEHGALGLICFGMIVFVTLSELWKTYLKLKVTSPESANLAAGLFLAIIAYLTTGIFLHFAYVRYFWLMMALAGCGALILRREAISQQASAPAAHAA